MDSYIDQFETLAYGRHAREQMAAVCLGLIKELDPMVHFAIARQAEADAAMKRVLDLVAPPAFASPSSAVEEARDALVRLNSYLESLKGRPVNPRAFFQGEAPSVLARRRLSKLIPAVAHVIEQLKEHREKIRDAKLWIGEFEPLLRDLKALEKDQRAAKVDRAHVAPEVAEARSGWLEVYGANKLSIRALLAHAGKPQLLPLVFDDLAEVHRAPGVTDDAPPPGGNGVAPAAPTGA